MTKDNRKDADSKNTVYGDLIKMLPGAAYLLRNTADFPILAANKAFYELFEYDPDEVRYRFGDRLTAMVNTEAYRRSIASGGQSPVFQHTITAKEGEHFLSTQICPVAEDPEVLVCISIEVTALAAAQKMLGVQDDLHRVVAEQMNFELFSWNVGSDTVSVYSSAGILADLGQKTDYQSLKSYLALRFAPYDKEKILPMALERMEHGRKSAVCELPWKISSGMAAWYRIILRRTFSEANGGPFVVGILQNITLEKETSVTYLRETQFYHTLLAEKAAYGHIDITEDRFLSVGGIWNLYNELIKEHSFSEIAETFINRVVHPEDRAHYLEIASRENIIHSFERGIRRLDCEFRRIVEQNKMVWMELGVHLFCDPTNRHLLALAYITDIDARKRQNLQLHYESERDQLTGTYNKKIAESTIREHFRKSEPGSLSALMILDLDDFKDINDRFGHRAGDEALVSLASVLVAVFGRNDVIGRFGGDEFIILMREIESQKFMEERLEAMYKGLKESGGRRRISCSAGVVLVSGKCRYDKVFAQADQALYEAKCKGKGRFIIYQGNTVQTEIKGQRAGKREKRIRLLDKRLQTVLEEDHAANPFDTFVGEQGDMAYLVDPETFNLICGNKAFYDRIGLTEQECRGMRCYEVMHRRDAPCPFCSKANWSSDKFYLWKDINGAMEQEFLIKNKLVNWQGREVLLALAVDISNDKSIVDSITSDATESHILIGGIQRMEEAADIKDAIGSILETIGHFFRADEVSFWEARTDGDGYECIYEWKFLQSSFERSGEDKKAVSGWLQGRRWDGPLMVESAEAMLGHSFEMYRMMKRGGLQNARWMQLYDKGEEFGCLSVANSSANFQNISFLDTVSDFMITEIKKRRMVEAVLHASRHDRLTDLLNRDSYEDYLRQFDPDALLSLGIVSANIDNLSGINNTRGTNTGNYYIKRFARRLREVFGSTESYRLNGDEFLVISENIEREDLERQVKELTALLLKEEDYTVSVGHSWDNVEKDISELIKTAYEAMRINKKKRYDAGMVTSDRERGRLLEDLMKDIKEGRFEIYLQPKFDMETHRAIGAEALIRRFDDVRGMIAPSEFIPLLEASNLIRYVDLFVLEEVCRLLERWKQEYHTELLISLNFSRVTLLEEDILKNIEQVLTRYNVSRANIEIEITESFVAGGKSTLYQVTQDLFNSGCNLSLDDFGVKYTNLSMLSDIEFHTLKLDKSLIKALANKESNQIILKNVIRLCEELGINVIAEGVETHEQKDILQGLGCVWGQGYLFGKPMSVREFEHIYMETADSALRNTDAHATPPDNP